MFLSVIENNQAICSFKAHSSGGGCPEEPSELEVLIKDTVSIVCALLFSNCGVKAGCFVFVEC